MSSKNLKVYRIQFLAQLREMQFKVKFPCKLKVMWKRSNESAETTTVPVENGVVAFNQTLKLMVNMYFDITSNKFIEKKCLFSFVIVTEKGQKSAGSIAYDLSELINQRVYEIEQDFVLQKCPLPDTKIHMKIYYEESTEQGYDSMSQISTQNMDESTASADLSGLIENYSSQKEHKEEDKPPQKDSLSENTISDSSTPSTNLVLGSNYEILSDSAIDNESQNGTNKHKIAQNIAALSSLTGKINEFVSQASGNIKLELSSLTQKNKKLEEQLSEQHIQRQKVEREMNDLKQTLAALEKSHSNEKAEFQSKVSKYESTVSQLTNKCQQSQKLCENMENNIQKDGQSQNNYITQLKSNFLQNEAQLKEQITNLNSSLLEQKKAKNDTDEEMKLLRTQFEAMKSKYRQLEQRKNELERTQATREAELTEVRMKFENVYESMKNSLGSILS